jgi:hypothetical protein
MPPRLAGHCTCEPSEQDGARSSSIAVIPIDQFRGRLLAKLADECRANLVPAQALLGIRPSGHKSRVDRVFDSTSILQVFSFCLCAHLNVSSGTRVTGPLI